MNKIKLIIICLFFSFASNYACAQADNEKVDWDKLEYYLYRELKAQHPDESEAGILQAVGYTIMKSNNRWERATIYFKKAVELDGKLYFSWYSLGLINIDTEEGYSYFEKAVEANPNFQAPYYWMAYYRCKNREDKKAIPLFQKYLEIAKDSKDEEGRIKIAEEVLKDLLSGKESENLRMIRREGK